MKACNLETVLFLYVDDILVGTPKIFGVEFRLCILEFVVKLLGAYGFLISKKKCHILKQQITFLGVLLNNLGFSSMDIVRSNALANIRSPRSIPELSIPLAQFNYFQNFIPQYSKLVLPLRQLCKENVFAWTKVHQDALDSIKLIIRLNFPNHAIDKNKQLFLMCDASKLAISFNLWQIVNGQMGLNLTESRFLSPAEANKASIARESLALVWSLKKTEHIIRSHGIFVWAWLTAAL